MYYYYWERVKRELHCFLRIIRCSFIYRKYFSLHLLFNAFIGGMDTFWAELFIFATVSDSECTIIMDKFFHLHLTRRQNQTNDSDSRRWQSYASHFPCSISISISNWIVFLHFHLAFHIKSEHWTYTITLWRIMHIVDKIKEIPYKG